MPLGKDYKYHFHFHKKSCLACCIRVLVRKLKHFYGLRPKSTLLHIFPSSSKYSDVFINEILLLACISQYDCNPSTIEISQNPILKKYKRALLALYCLYIYGKYNVRICIVAVSSNTS